MIVEIDLIPNPPFRVFLAFFKAMTVLEGLASYGIRIVSLVLYREGMHMHCC